MAKICQICNRRAVVGNSRSHSNIASRRSMSINLQRKKIGTERLIVCTSCIKTLNKLKKQTTI